MIDIERSQPAPASLAEERGWRGDDVKARLREDFLRKCYLCEGLLGRAFEVEHRRPRSVGGGEHDWHNLFPAHHDCNNGRPAYPPEGLISPGEGVEPRLRQWLDAEYLPCFMSEEPDDVLARNTARELEHLHRSGTDAADQLRTAIVSQVAHVLELQSRLLVLKLDGRGDTSEARELEHDLRHQVSREAPYSRLVRSKLEPRVLESLG